MKEILIKYLKTVNYFLLYPSWLLICCCLQNKWPLKLLKPHLLHPKLRLFIFNILPASFSVLVQDWGKIMAYLGYYGCKCFAIMFSILKEKKLMVQLPFEGILVLMLVVAFLALAASREAKEKKRRENIAITDQTETDSLLGKLLY